MRTDVLLVAGLCGMLTMAAAAPAYAVTAEQQCIREKYRAWGKYIACQNKVHSRVLLGVGSVADLTKCWDRSRNRMQRAERFASCRLVDNGDGTVTDLDMGLMWEKKTDAASAALAFDWLSARTDYLSALNGTISAVMPPPVGTPGFAGYGDWRLPHSGEIGTLMNGTCEGPCADPVLGPIAAGPHWSSTGVTGDPSQAWAVVDTGLAVTLVLMPVSDPLPVRAVRNAFPSQ